MGTPKKKTKKKTDSLEIYPPSQKKTNVAFVWIPFSIFTWVRDDCPCSSVLVVLYFESLPGGMVKYFRRNLPIFLLWHKWGFYHSIPHLNLVVCSQASLQSVCLINTTYLCAEPHLLLSDQRYTPTSQYCLIIIPTYLPTFIAHRLN